MHARTVIDSPIGPLFLATNERGVTNLAFGSSRERKRRAAIEGQRSVNGGATPAAEASARDAAEVHLSRLIRQLREYFDGERTSFDLELDLHGTEFQRRIWEGIASIPFGEVLSYGEVASMAGAPGASRAAGAACGANPVALVVPCHRVVGADRSLHGFGGGLDVKQWLLNHEGVTLKSAGSLQPALA